MPITREIETRTSPSYDLLERSVLPLKVEEVRRGRDVLDGPSVFLVMRREYHQTVGLRIRQRFDNPGVDTAEDGSVCADAEGESEHGDGGEAGRFPQYAQTIAQILYEVLYPVHASGVAAFLFGLLDTPQVQPRLPPRFFWC